jgi:hypothetical protein
MARHIIRTIGERMRSNLAFAWAFIKGVSKDPALEPTQIPRGIVTIEASTAKWI